MKMIIWSKTKTRKTNKLWLITQHFPILELIFVSVCFRHQKIGALCKDLYFNSCKETRSKRARWQTLYFQCYKNSLICFGIVVDSCKFYSDLYVRWNFICQVNIQNWTENSSSFKSCSDVKVTVSDITPCFVPNILNHTVNPCFAGDNSTSRVNCSRPIKYTQNILPLPVTNFGITN